MTTTNLKPQHQTTVIGQLLDLKEQIKYHETHTAPFYNEMAEWERKEYVAVYKDNVSDFHKKIEYIKNNEANFNEILSQYNLSVATFIDSI